jgi:opacity protein-like surface antigen
MSVEGTETTGFDPAVDAHSVTTKSTQEFNDSGLIGGAFAGIDHVLGNRFLVGLLGGYNWSAIEDKEGEWFVGGRAGILLDPRVLAYGVVVWTGTEFGGQDYDGIGYGGGLEYALNHKVFIGMEYLHTDYGSETLVNTPMLNVKSELKEDRIMGRVRFNLNNDLFGN